jgi:hypothetical protein
VTIPDVAPETQERAEIVPLTLAEARRYVAEHHRHNEPPIGHRFSIGLRRGTTMVGVVIAGHPVARGADDGRTIELVRLTTEGDRNACSRLYSAAFAMGYLRVITYTLEEEPGTSLRAAGFTMDHATPGAEWLRPNQPKRGASGALLSLWGDRKMPTGPKIRWSRSAS